MVPHTAPSLADWPTSRRRQRRAPKPALLASLPRLTLGRLHLLSPNSACPPPTTSTMLNPMALPLVDITPLLLRNPHEVSPHQAPIAASAPCGAHPPLPMPANSRTKPVENSEHTPSLSSTSGCSEDAHIRWHKRRSSSFPSHIIVQYSTF